MLHKYELFLLETNREFTAGLFVAGPVNESRWLAEMQSLVQ
jgi:hypothetical protein